MPRDIRTDDDRAGTASRSLKWFVQQLRPHTRIRSYSLPDEVLVGHMRSRLWQPSVSEYIQGRSYSRPQAHVEIDRMSGFISETRPFTFNLRAFARGDDFGPLATPASSRSMVSLRFGGEVQSTSATTCRIQYTDDAKWLSVSFFVLAFVSLACEVVAATLSIVNWSSYRLLALFSVGLGILIGMINWSLWMKSPTAVRHQEIFARWIEELPNTVGE